MSERYEITSTHTTVNHLTIEPQNGYTIEQIIELLNAHEVDLSGDSIMQWAAPPAEGGTAVAKVGSRRMEASPGTWRVVS